MGDQCAGRIDQMSETPAPGTVLAQIDEIPEPGARVSSWRDGAVVLIRRNGEVTAWLNACPHAQMRLNLPSGKVLLHKDGFIVCPVHGASFDATTGACTGGPAAGDGLAEVAIEVSGQQVLAK
jgi:nitrite reductase/ring-hydroxylating ferredoxin subunit